MLASACKLLGAEDGGVGLVNEHPLRIVMEAVHNLPESELRSEWFPGEGMAGVILQTKKPIIINRYGDIDPKKRPELKDNSVLGVPIFRRKRMIGFFGIGARSPRQFSQADVRVLAQFAKACAAAIENAQLHEETRSALAQTKLLYETTTDLSRARNLDDVVSAYLTHIATDKAHNCSVVVYELDHEGQRKTNVLLGTSRKGSKIDLDKRRMRHTHDKLDKILDQGETVTFVDIFKDKRAPKELQEVQATDGNPALALIPLMSRGTRIGLVTLSLDKPHVWTPEELQPFQVTSAHLAAAIDIRQEQERLASERSNLALVEERKRIARDLHDSVTQSLFAMQLLSQALSVEVSEDVRPRADRLAELCKSSLTEMRALLGELRPIEEPRRPDDRRSLLRARIERHASEIGLTARLDVDDKNYIGSLPEVEHAVFRIAQEAVTNSHKHSQCTEIQIQIVSRRDLIDIMIADNGIGFANRERREFESFGLVGINERAQSLGGRVEIESEPGNGTVIRATIPGGRS